MTDEKTTAPSFSCAPGQPGYCDGCPVCQPAAPARKWGTGPGQTRRDCGHEQPGPDECAWCLVDAAARRSEADTAALTKVRDDLRIMFVRWHIDGVHATYDTPVIERAILALDTFLRGLKP